MLATIPLVLGMVLTVTGTACGQTEEAAKSQLLGLWAVDCSKPPHFSNKHNLFEEAEGGALHYTEFRGGDDRERATVEKIVVHSPTRFAVELHEYAPIDLRYTVTLEVTDIRMTYLQSVVGNAQVVIKDGKFIGFPNQPVLVLQRCKAKTTPIS
jgi:hypothetical protein